MKKKRDHQMDTSRGMYLAQYVDRHLAIPMSVSESLSSSPKASPHPSTWLMFWGVADNGSLHPD